MIITITEALATLKNINNKIDKTIQELNVVSCHTKNASIIGYSSTEEFEKKAKSSFQSVKDLIERRNNIKSAIVASNAITNVTIGDKIYSIASAIERKSSIEIEQNLLNKITKQFASTNLTIEKLNKQSQDKLDILINTTFGKDSKVDAGEIEKISQGFWSKNETVISDVLKCRELMEKMSNEINEFITNVDIQLSISNATHTIEVQ